MPNIFDCSSYALGKLHIGMIVYLCEMWNEEEKEPLLTLARGIGLELPSEKIFPHREYHGIDLVLLSGSSQGKPLAAIEMKVDDHEHDTSRKGIEGKRRMPQTELYPLIPEMGECKQYFFVTLGAGEFYRKPANHAVFKWIKLDAFAQAIRQIKSLDELIKQWSQALDAELERRNSVKRNPIESKTIFRSGGWNLTLFGQIKEALAPDVFIMAEGEEPTVYCYGQSPDTILNFGHCRNETLSRMDIYKQVCNARGDHPDEPPIPLYSEINNNGKLNLKVWLGYIPDAEEKHKYAESVHEQLFSHFNTGAWELHEVQRKTYKKTATIIRIDVGLQKQAPQDRLWYRNNRQDTVEKIESIVRKLYR